VAEGTIGAWIKQEGDYIEKDEAIAEIITDKISAELPSPIAGRLTKILVQVDETVPVETDIALIEESADISSTLPSQTKERVEQALIPVSQQPVASNATSNGGIRADRARRDGEEERHRISPLARRLAREHGIDLTKIV